MSSIGAGAVHAAATGVHAEHPELARLFVVLAAAQLGAGLWALLRPSRNGAWAVGFVNVIAVAGWLVTRITGVSWIEGLEVREAAQFADSACALLGAVAAGAAFAGTLVGWRPSLTGRISLPSIAVAALAVPAMWMGGTHVHSHSAGASSSDGHSHDAVVTNTTPSTIADSTSDTASAAPDDTVASDAALWPRPWDPAVGIDLSGVPGVSAEQQDRAQALIDETLQVLPRWADTADAVAEGYISIGDAGTGSEHYIKGSLINDGVMLDPTQPESLVYNVVGDQRVLAGVMFIASPRPTDDPSLTDWAGPLMTWHNHGNLCWDLENGKLNVVGVLNETTGTCVRGFNAGGEVPMVHVWIVAHQCGPFAALEGQGAGQAAVPDDQRVDMCQNHTH
ncbi:MAG: hypothetical protein K8R99_03540 [Actinomycetia bacterium]|nr:hypothetical protein [Actinomycetes bacterium]